MITRSYRKLFKRKEGKREGEPEGERWDYNLREEKEECEAKKGNRKQTKKIGFGSISRSMGHIIYPWLTLHIKDVEKSLK